MNSENIFVRSSLLKKLRETKNWDVLIIGGGATGLGCAVDSASRGYKTLLLEQCDFAKGTSSRSTKLAHGGVRYLEQGNIDLVKEALHERGLLLKNAPHLVNSLNFIIPNYKWWEHFYYRIGLKIYDFLANKQKFGKSKHLQKKETLSRLPNLQKKSLRGSVLYKDGQFDDARLAVNLAQTAIEKGATVLNYIKVSTLQKNKEQKITGVCAKDQETGETYELSAKTIINATGVFSDLIMQMDHKEDKKIIQPSQGVHLVFNQHFFPGKDALLIPKTSDGRILFAVPWHQKVLVGTTDTPLKSHSLEPKAFKKEIEFILETFNRYASEKATKKDIQSVFAGLRPLAAANDNTKKTKEISRSHKIIVAKSGLVSITGGKWTTYRKMAEDTLNKAISLGQIPQKKCITETLPIHGSALKVEKNNPFYIYGSDLPKLEKLKKENPALSQKLHKDFAFTQAEVVWAARYEMARSVEDVLARRLRILFLHAQAAIDMAPKVAEILATELSKTKKWQALQIETFTELANNYLVIPKRSTD